MMFPAAQYAQYRLPDTLFWSIILCGVLVCICHAAARVFRRPSAATAPAAGLAVGEVADDETIERHTLFQRMFHWANFMTVAILLVSGVAIYRPPILPFLTGSTASWFSWHQWFTPIFLALVLAHVLYEFRAPDHLDQVWFGREEYHTLTAIVRHRLDLRPESPRQRKYHPAQILFHWAIAGNLFALVLTGFVLWKPFRALLPLSLLGLGWDFIFYNRTIHTLLTATLAALILCHIYFALLVRAHWPATRSMITGRISREESVGHPQTPARMLTARRGSPVRPAEQ